MNYFMINSGFSNLLGYLQQASGDELRAAMDVGRKQYQPKQLK